MKTKSANSYIGIFTLLTLCLLPLKGFCQDPDFYIFLAFGQSNMEGYPGLEDKDKTGVDPRFQFLSAVDCPSLDRTKGEWTTAVPPLCRCSNGLNPADYFGRTLVDSLPEHIKVGVINVSVAGCAIEMFDKGKYQSYLSNQADWLKNIANEYGGNPYARLVEMGRQAKEDGVIKGFLLHQGESGSTTNQWANEVKIIYNDLIEDLELEASDIPLLAGDLVNPSRMVQDLPSVLDNSYVISSEGLENIGDGLHFSPSGYRELGKRYALTMLDILGDIPTEASIKIPNASYALWAGPGSVSFTIPHTAFVTLKAHTLGGKEVAELAGAEYSTGRHTLLFRRNILPPGALILRMEAGSFSTTRAILSPSTVDLPKR